MGAPLHVLGPATQLLEMLYEIQKLLERVARPYTHINKLLTLPVFS